MAIGADILQAAAHKAERLVIGPPLQLMYPSHCLLIEDVATDSINRVRRVTNDSAMSERLNHLGNQSRLGILWVNTDHKHVR